jgi:hypothetical protein
MGELALQLSSHILHPPYHTIVDCGKAYGAKMRPERGIHKG